MTEGLLTITISGLFSLLGVLILVAQYNNRLKRQDDDNPAMKAGRIDLTVLAIVFIVGGLIVMIREW